MIESAGFVNVEIVDERPGVNGTEKWCTLVKNLTIKANKPLV